MLGTKRHSLQWRCIQMAYFNTLTELSDNNSQDKVQKYSGHVVKFLGFILIFFLVFVKYPKQIDLNGKSMQFI